MKHRRPSSDDVYIPNPSVNDHDRIVLISRHMDALIAERLRTRPELLSIAKATLARWIKQQRETSGFVSRIFRDWKKILSEKTVNEIIALLLSETHEADRLRSSSPFCGMITEEERMAIFKSHAKIAA